MKYEATQIWKLYNEPNIGGTLKSMRISELGMDGDQD